MRRDLCDKKIGAEKSSGIPSHHQTPEREVKHTDVPSFAEFAASRLPLMIESYASGALDGTALGHCFKRVLTIFLVRVREMKSDSLKLCVTVPHKPDNSVSRICQRFVILYKRRLEGLIRR